MICRVLPGIRRRSSSLWSRSISAVLNRFLTGDISETEVEGWANAIECREDIAFLQPSLVAETILALANPLLTRPLTRQSASQLVAALHGAAT